MRRAPLWVALACLLAAPEAARADAADYVGKRIATRHVRVEGREITDSRVLALIETRVNSPLSLAAVRESVTHLFALGRYEDVRVDASAVAEGVALVYDLVPLHPIRKIVFTGPLTEPGVDQGRMRKAIVDRFGTSPPAGRRLDLARIAEDDLREHGYLHPVVTPRVEISHAPDRAVLIFALDPGRRTAISSIDVVGNPGVPTRQLLNRLDLKVGAPYERDALVARMQRYQAGQHADGYVEATLTVGTRFDEEDRVVALTLTAQQGRRVNVVFKGDAIPGGKHEDLVPIVSQGSADEDLLEDSSRRIEDYLHGLGYRDAVAPHQREELDNELRVTFTVTRGPLYRVSDVVVAGNVFEPLAALEPRLGVHKGQPLSTAALVAAVSMITDVYRRQGFAAVKVEASIVRDSAPTETQVPVTVTLDITEGVRTLVTSVRFQGNQSVADAALREGLGLRPEQPFFLTQMAIDRDFLEIQYANRGYQSATVSANPGLSADAARADVVFMINEGPQIIVDHLLIVGNQRTSTETIERELTKPGQPPELQIKPGQPLGLAAVSDSQRRLAALGLFRRVRIAQVPYGEETRRDVVVTVEEAPVTSIGYGGGIEALPRVVGETAAEEQLQFAPRGFFEIGRRNLFGSTRSVNLFSRVSLRPGDASHQGWKFQDYRIFGTFREPRLFGTLADAYLTGTLEQQSRSSFSFKRRAFSTEVGRGITRTVSLSGNYQIQRTSLFDDVTPESDRLLIDRLFPQLLLSSFSIAGVQSTKDDAVNPTKGHYFSASGQLAARQFGSEVGLFKSYFSAQLFRTLPHVRRTVFASSVRLGMAKGFQTSVQSDLPASERFFAGGDTTVRGFALDQLGTPSTLDPNGFAIGGNAVAILNVELRVPLYRAIGVVGFFDAGNVFHRTTDIDLLQLRSAVGVGFRYRSPVGPIRVDIGFKTHPHEVIPGVREKGYALHISLGQAF